MTKPGIIQGNAVHIVAGALLSSVAGVPWSVVLAVTTGTSFVIASACVANNYMDRTIDAKMKRTKLRASVTGVISLHNAMIFTAILFVIGFGILFKYTNLTVVVIGLMAYVLYVFAYGWAKRRTVHSTLVGAVPGALPAMAGFVAVDGGLSVSAGLVFLLVFFWQLPHFYAISVFRKKEYQAAGLPVLSVKRPFNVVRAYIFAYIFAYFSTVTLLIIFDVVGAPAGLLLLAGSGYWMTVYASTNTSNQEKWARSVFDASLILTLLLLLASLLNVFVPPM